MILTQLKSHLRLNQTASLFDMALRFNTEPNVIRDMLQLWINKGKVRKCMKTPQCGSKCSKCDPLLTEVYQWVETESCS